MLTPIDPLIQHIASQDPKLWEALKRLSDSLLKNGVITQDQLSTDVNNLISIQPNFNIDWFLSNLLKSSRISIDFEQGTGISLALIDDIKNDRAKLTIASSLLIGFYLAGTLESSRIAIDFEAGIGISLALVDDIANSRAKLTITNTSTAPTTGSLIGSCYGSGGLSKSLNGNPQWNAIADNTQSFAAADAAGAKTYFPIGGTLSHWNILMTTSTVSTHNSVLTIATGTGLGSSSDTILQITVPGNNGGGAAGKLYSNAASISVSAGDFAILHWTNTDTSGGADALFSSFMIFTPA